MKVPFMIRIRHQILVGVLTALFVVPSPPADGQSRAANVSAAADPRPRVTVFQAGEEGYNIYRIPAIIKTAAGDLLAFCEAREGGDASEIDLVMKRSQDLGQSWGPLQVVQHREHFRHYFTAAVPPITVGNPAPVVDLLDPIHPGRIWLPFTLENDRVFVTYSDDDGATWSEAIDITAAVKQEDWGWYATGPVHSIQIQSGSYRGRLIVPCDHRLGGAGDDRGPLGAHVIFSDDHGSTWQLGAIDDTYDDGLDANETSVAELSDGLLYFNTRDQNGDAPGTRGESWSTDGGITLDARSEQWQAFRPVNDVLDPPVVQCSLLSVAPRLLLFSGPDDDGPTGPGRSDLRIRYSNNQAESWRDGPLIHRGPAAYSDMVQTADDRVGVLFECGDAGQKSAYQRIDFLTISTGELAAAR